MKRSPDHDAILALPHRHHPMLTRAVETLAAHPKITLGDAHQVLDGVCAECQIDQLQIEMCQPGVNVAVPFAKATSTDPADGFQASVSRHLRQILGVSHA